MKRIQSPICLIRHGYFPDDPRCRKEAAALLENGYAVDIVCLRKPGQPRRERWRGARIYRIPLSHKRASIGRYFFEYGLSFLLMHCFVLLLHLARGYRLIQFNTMPDFFVFMTLVPRLLGARVLIDFHEPTPELWVTKFGDKFHVLYRLQKRIQLWALAYAHHSITVTETLCQTLFDRGARRGKIDVIPNVCEESFEATIQTYKRSEGQNHAEFRLITHGLIEERYGHDLVIRALTMLPDRYDSIVYEIVGSGEHEQALQRLASQLGCADRVRFYGFLPFEDMLQRIFDADVGVIPMKQSPYSELIDTNKMYEYMAIRKPVIVSQLPAVAHVFDSSCVMFFQPDDCEDLVRTIIEMYENHARRGALTRNAYRRYSQMRWAVTKKKYLAIVRHTLEGNNVGARMGHPRAAGA
ncbi:MAG: glycosyltransferase family 4 protein [Sedimentisphaerales bacterium]|nr:glycosyltransferase family 4 protein [Sedimentisphaerales bacterium]